MTSRTGLSQTQVAILKAVGDSATFQKCASALDRLPDDFELGALSAYEELCALATPWTAVLPLLEPLGNFGTSGRDDPPAEARYTECRLTPVGAAALAAESGGGPPVPIGLVLGDWFAGGRRPPFDPGRVADAVLLAGNGDVRGAVDRLGSPFFPGGLSVTSTSIGEDPRALAQGWLVRARIDARIEPSVDSMSERPRPGLDIVTLPPGVGSSQVASTLAEVMNAVRRATGKQPIREINDETSWRFGTKIHIVGARDVELDVIEALLRAVPGVYSEFDLQLPRPAGELLQRWVAGHGLAEARAGAELLLGLTRP